MSRRLFLAITAAAAPAFCCFGAGLLEGDR